MSLNCYNTTRRYRTYRSIPSPNVNSKYLSSISLLKFPYFLLLQIYLFALSLYCILSSKLIISKGFSWELEIIILILSLNLTNEID